MSILIIGMNKPETCDECPIRLGPAAEACGLDRGHCPIIEVLEIPSCGRMIDANALKKDLEKRWNVSDDQDFCNKEVWHALEEAPTVYVAEPEDHLYEQQSAYRDYCMCYETTYNPEDGSM